MGIREIPKLLGETFAEWRKDRAPHLAAALAFYAVLSFAPVLVIAIAVASMVFGRETVREELISGFRDFLGPGGAKTVRNIILQAREQSRAATAAGVGMMIFGATAVFAELQEALNTMWGVTVKPGNDIRMFFRKRLLSFLMVLGIGLVLLSSLVLGTAVTVISGYLRGSIPIPPLLIETAQFVVSFVIVTLLFASIYKVLPDVQIAWSDVWTGAAATALLFNIGKTLIGIYLANTTVGSAYGAAGSLVLLLVWVYYSAQVFFFGAEFTQVYARWRGRPIEPSRNAVRFSKTLHGLEAGKAL